MAISDITVNISSTWIKTEWDWNPSIPEYSPSVICGTSDIATEPINIIPQTIEITKQQNKIEGVDIMNLYEVYLIYAEDRKKPVIKKKTDVIAKDEEDAKVKSGLMKQVDEAWDSDYLTLIGRWICDVKVKEKPKEVKNV